MKCVASRLLVGTLAGIAIAAAIPPPITAQTTGAKERYNATAQNLQGGMAATGTGRVLIAVDRWSTEAERLKLITVFNEKGPFKLLDALKDYPIAGTIKFPNTLAWDLRYAFETPLPEGGRKVVLATDRPISMEEARKNPISTDYPFTLIQIQFNKDGVGQGKMSMATKIQLSRDKKSIELENYGQVPVRLSEVRIEK